MTDEERQELEGRGKRLLKALNGDVERLTEIMLNVRNAPTRAAGAEEHPAFQELRDFISELDGEPYTDLVEKK